MMSAIDHVDHVASLHIAISPFTLTLSKVKKKKKNVQNLPPKGICINHLFL